MTKPLIVTVQIIFRHNRKSNRNASLIVPCDSPVWPVFRPLPPDADVFRCRYSHLKTPRSAGDHYCSDCRNRSSRCCAPATHRHIKTCMVLLTFSQTVSPLYLETFL